MKEAREKIRNRKTTVFNPQAIDKCAELVVEYMDKPEAFACPWNHLALQRAGGGLCELEPTQTIRFLTRHVGAESETQEMKILLKLLKQKLEPRLWSLLLNDLKDILENYR